MKKHLTSVIALGLVIAIASCTNSPAQSGSGGTPAATGGAPGSGGVGSGGTVGSSGGVASGGTVGSSGGVRTGGSSSSGGVRTGGSSSGGGGGGSACSNVTPCGGDVTGTWTVTSSCLNVSGKPDMSLWGLGCTTASASVTGTLKVTGTWTATSDGKYTDNTTTSGNEVIALAKECLLLSGTTVTCQRIGMVVASFFDSFNCTDDAASGGCTCAATIQQTGWAALQSQDASTSGRYTASGNVLTLDGEAAYSYCVSGGNKMTWTPVGTTTPANPTITGTVVFQKGGSGGSGGTGSGGVTGSGGATGGGGGTAKGGATGSGGVTGGGGATGSGGKTGSGGAGGAASSGGVTGGGGAPASGGSTGPGTRTDGPCDIYAAASPATPCAAAYSMVRALSKSYTGPLYQVRSGSSSANTGTGGTTQDIGMTADGFADTAAQDAFCTSTCTVSKLYDQSGNSNDLVTGTKGTYNCPSGQECSTDYESSATKGAVTAGGHKVYSLYMNSHEGYRTPLNVKGKNVPTGNTAEGIYELADGTHSGGACCWDFGNVSPDPATYVTMNTLFFGTGYWGTGAGSGPWFMGDFEGGVWAGGSGAANANNPNSPSMKVSFALGILHTPVGKYALRMADVQTATDLTTAYDGASPKTWGNAGGIVLGVGGDNSNNSSGTFYEGAVTNGAPSNATDLLIMKNIQTVGYKK